MDKLVTEDSTGSRPFKPQVYQSGRGRNQNKGNFHGRFRDNACRGCSAFNQNFRGRYRDNFNRRGNSRGSQGYRGNYYNQGRNNYRGQGYDRNRSRSLDRQDRNRRRDRSVSNGRSRSGSRASMNRDRITCYECREYDHFAKDCPTKWEKREMDQIQQMFNLEDEQVITQTSFMDIDKEETITPIESGNSLNLWEVEMIPPHFYLLDRN